MRVGLTGDPHMPVVDVKVFYLQMLTYNRRPVPSPRSGLTVLHAQKPSVASYRFLYDAVGKEYHWFTRGSMPDAELAAVIQHPRNEVHVLCVDGCPAGFAELDRRDACHIELVQFGLMRDYIGQGLGKYFLHWTIDKAWSYAPECFWLHTCTLDHPAALPNYQKAGFVLYKEEMIQREIENA
jgi:GNAT superfamily N-acetyltransferase